MKKRNSLSYETVKTLFDADAESENVGSYFRINGGRSSTTVSIPTSLMHRLFRLGQAYGIRQLRYLEPDVKIIIGSVELPEFVRDLRKLRDLINDEVLHEYVDRLLVALEGEPGLAAMSIAVSTGDYFGNSEWPRR